MLRAAVIGCTHGELDAVYSAIGQCERQLEESIDLSATVTDTNTAADDGRVRSGAVDIAAVSGSHAGTDRRGSRNAGGVCAVDVVLCCGDFQAVRDAADLETVAVPQRFRRMGDFEAYYTGRKVAPALTLFIGGNHEASRHLLEMPYGGWVAPNIYYVGHAGVVRVLRVSTGRRTNELGSHTDGRSEPSSVESVRVAGISGIFKQYDYQKGHWERYPFTSQAERSVYHVREIDVFRLLQIDTPLDVAMSHDWPQGIVQYGNKQDLFRRKSFLRDEEHTFGNPAATKLLHILQPRFWFSGHMHAQFAALVQHESEESEKDTDRGKVTRFLALGKPVPGQQFMQILDMAASGANSFDDQRLFRARALAKHSALQSEMRPNQNVNGQEDEFKLKQDEKMEARMEVSVETRLAYDLEWLCILASTLHLHKPTMQTLVLPTTENVRPGERYDFRVSQDALQCARAALAEHYGVEPAVVGSDSNMDPLLIDPAWFVEATQHDDPGTPAAQQHRRFIALLDLVASALNSDHAEKEHAADEADAANAADTQSAEDAEGAAGAEEHSLATTANDKATGDCARNETNQPPTKRSRSGQE